MNVHLAKFMTYFKIHQMDREGQSASQISKFLVINRRTVKKYLDMSEQEYEEFLVKQSERKKELLPYEIFVKDRLRLYQETPSAQMHDWLKEYHPDFPKVNPKTVFTFVNWVRGKYNLPRINIHRQCHPVEELPYGKQAQIDFGEYNLRTSTGIRVKVFFFVLVLSRSRFKYVWFTDRPFTSELAIEAHEKAFDYIQGIPDVIVYDQDKVFIVDENKGAIVLTEGFRAYTREQAFTLHFCRKADPQSKGKVENAVKYVKQNFLSNQSTHGIDALGAYFGDSTLDTISYCNKPITYLMPQISNPTLNVITDTLNWTAISGTFVATGSEKYCVIGNFRSDANTNIILTNTTNLPSDAADYYLDDISVIDVDLPAYAGLDKRFIVGDSVFLGRQPEVAIDEACQWFQVPNMSVPIATIAGLWVKPVQTTTYIVRQQLWCSGVKYDTVVVFEDAVGLNKMKMLEDKLVVSPQPGDQKITISIDGQALSEIFSKIEIMDQTGRKVTVIPTENNDDKIDISLTDLPAGIYLLRLFGHEDEPLVIRKLSVIH